MKICLFFLSFFFLNFSFSQNSVVEQAYPQNIISKYYGETFSSLSNQKQQLVISYLTLSYQIIHAGADFVPTNFDIVQYEGKRTQSEDVTFQLKDGTTIKIFAHEHLSSPAVELRTTFVY